MLNRLRIPTRILALLILSVLTMLVLNPVFAVFTPLAAEFQVNDANASLLNDFRSDMAMDSSGNFVIVWQRDVDATQSDISFKRYNGSGVQQGSQVTVNGGAEQTEDQRFPQVAMNTSNGTFVVVWTSDDDTSAGIDYNIHYRLYNASGTALTSEAIVNTTGIGTTSAQTDTRVAMDSSGDFVVVWQSLDASSVGVFFQRFNSSGVAQGSETQANTSTTGPQSTATVAMDSSGNFVIAWRDGAVPATTPDITMRKFDSSGAAVTAEVSVDNSSGTQQAPHIVMRPSTGDVVVVWDSNESTPNLETYFQRYNSSLVAQGSRTLVPGDTSVANSVPDVAMDSAGEFTITWEKDAGSGTSHAQGKRYTATGTLIGSEFQIDTSGTAGRTYMTVGMSDQNHTAFAWATGDDLFARVYVDRADLVITKTSDVPAYTPLSGVYVPGSPIKYTITVSNSGPSAVVGATVTDTFTAAHTGINWTCVASGTASCVSGSPSGTGASGSTNISQSVDIGTGGGDKVTYTVTANTAANASANLTNSASVSTPATTYEIDSSTNTAALDLPAQKHVDVAVSKTASSGPYHPGDNVTYTITVTANGPSAVPPISVSDSFDAAFSSESWTCVANGTASCVSSSPSGTGDSGTGNISKTVDVAAGGGNSVVYTVIATIDAATSVTSIDNTANVSVSGVTDDNSANNSSLKTITVTPGQTATHLAFLQQSTDTAAGATITPAVTVQVLDASNAVVSGDNTTQVTLAIGTNPGGGALGGTLTVTVVNGVATFSTLSIDNAGTGYTLTAASTPSLTGDTSDPFNITQTATHLAFVQQPTDTAAGGTITPAVTVQVLDASNAVVSGDNSTQITLAIGTNPSAGTLGGTLTVTVVNGVATFSTLSIDNAGTGYTLTAASTPSLTGDTSTPFNITQTATHLAFVQQPTDTAAGATITPAVTVQVLDASNAVVSGDNSTQVTLAIGTNPSAGTLGGTLTVTVVNGVATFSTLSIDNAGTGYTLTAASTPSLTGDTSDPFNITAVQTATHLAFVQQPTDTAAGGTITPAVTVQVLDAANAVVSGDNTTQITLAIGTNPSAGTLGGALTVTVVNGVATFSTLSIDNAGTGYTLTAASTPSLTGDTSDPFNITAVQTATHLAFLQQPTDTAAGATITPAVTVQVLDASNAVVSGDNTTQITLAIGTNPSAGTLGGTLTVTVVNGVATFSTLSIDNAGTGYTLTAASTPSLTGDTSDPFNITAVQTATHLAFLQQPTDTAAGATITPAVTVQVLDAANAVVSGDNTTQITLAIGTNPSAGTLGGTLTVTVVNGVATFSTLSIDNAGTGYTLTAASTPSLTGDTSDPFNITAVQTATHLAFAQQPTDTAAGGTITPAVTVQVLDASNAVVSGDNTTQVTLAIGTNPSAGTLGGTLTVTVVNGVATFSTLSIDNAGTGYTLTAASTPSLTGDTSDPFNITAVQTATHLAFLQQPTDTAAGATITPAVTVQVLDAANAVVSGDNTTQVTLAIGTNPSAGTLGGTLTVTVVNGVATFSTLSIDNAGTGYTLTAASTPSLTGDTSDPFNIIAFDPNAIVGTVYNDQNSNGTQDPGDNGLSGATVFLDTNNSGGLDGGEQSTTTDGSGHYTFSGLSAGTYHVALVVPANFGLTTPGTVDVTVPLGAPASTNFGLHAVSQPPPKQATQPPPTPIIVDPLITKSVNPPFAKPGESAVWTITISNPAPVAATGVSVGDDMPSVVQIDKVAATSGTISFVGQHVAFSIASVAPGQTVTITITTHVRSDAQLPFVVTNRATITNAEDQTARLASATLTGVSDLPHTGEPLTDGVRLGIVAVVLIGITLVIRAAWAQLRH